MTVTEPRTTSPNGHKPQIDRVPPNNLDAERSLLGALLLSRDACDTTIGTLEAGAFYSKNHGHVYSAISALHDRDDPVDPITVADELRRSGLLDDIGGKQELVGLQIATPAAPNAGHYAKIVQHHATLRELISFAATVTTDAYALPETLTGLRRLTESALEALDRSTSRGGARQFNAVLDSWLEDMNRRAQGDRAATPTGFGGLDTALGGGLHPGQLIIVAGRTSMGKTAFAGGLALNCAQAGHQVLMCSIEMGTLELADRWVAATSKVPLATIRTGDLSLEDWSRIETAMARLGERPIWVDDHDEITVSYLRGLARSTPQPPAVLIVDYLQLLRPAARYDNRQEAVAEISSSLKKLARRLQIPIVALAQLNRGVENRQDKRPMLTDLRESGSIENDADVVIGLYRDRYYNRAAKGDDSDVLEAIIMKQRSGPLTTVKLEFAAEISAVLNPPAAF